MSSADKPKFSSSPSTPQTTKTSLPGEDPRLIAKASSNQPLPSIDSKVEVSANSEDRNVIIVSKSLITVISEAFRPRFSVGACIVLVSFLGITLYFILQYFLR